MVLCKICVTVVECRFGYSTLPQLTRCLNSGSIYMNILTLLYSNLSAISIGWIYNWKSVLHPVVGLYRYIVITTAIACRLTQW